MQQKIFILPPKEWINVIKTTTAMRDFASSCISKTNFAGVDVCLFDLCTCLDYAFDVDTRFANASQESIILIFVPNAHDCHFMQQLISKMYITELINEEQCEKQQKIKESMLRIDEVEWKREGENPKKGILSSKRKNQSPPSHTKKVWEKGGEAKKKKVTLMLLNTNTH